MRQALYNVAQRLAPYPGGWRVARLANRIVGDHYFPVPYFEGEIYASPVHHLIREVYRGGVYEPVVIDLIRSYVRRCYDFVDVGAYIGLHTLPAVFARVFASQKVICFEPEPSNFALLEKNVKLNGLNPKFIQCHNKAIGDREGNLTLHLSTTANNGRHTLVEGREKTTANGPIVPVTTLDSLDLHGPVLFKIDVEGFEAQAVRGGLGLFSRLAEIALIIEISLDGDNEREIDSLLAPLGLFGSDIPDPDTIENGKRIKSYVNKLYVRS